MVRLRSNRWYASDGQRTLRRQVGSRATGTRRLISLCFLLALVILLMQKAADPRHVSNAFRAIGVPLEESHSQASNSASKDIATAERVISRSPAAATDEPTRWAITCVDLLPRLLGELNANQLNTLTMLWLGGSQNASPEQASAINAIARASQQQLKQLKEKFVGDATGGTPEPQWAQLLDRFGRSWQELLGTLLEPATPVDPAQQREQLDPTLRASLTRYLDQRLLDGLEDAAPWKRSEQLAFWRLLQFDNAIAPPSPDAGNAALPAGGPLLDTRQLQSESLQRRGQTVRFNGTLQRTGAQTRVNPYTGNEEQYYQFWLRGIDRSNQPVAAYTRLAAAERLVEIHAAAPEQAIDVELGAMVGKRIAYQSASGLQVAPTLFIRSLDVTSQASSGLAVAEQPNGFAGFGYILLLAVVISAAIVGPIILQNRRQVRPTSKAKRLAILFTLSQLSTATAQDVQPPWQVAEEENAAVSLLTERLQETLDGSVVEELQTGMTPPSTAPLPDAILKTLRVLRQIDWAIEPLAPLSIAPDCHVRYAQVSGRVTQVTPVKLSEPQAAWFRETGAPDVVFVLSLITSQHQEGGQDVQRTTYCICTQVPARWKNLKAINQPATVKGLELSMGEEAEAMILLAPRPIWRLPAGDGSSAELSPKLPVHLERLGKAGWDLAMLDEVARHNQRPIDSRETEAFLTIMRAVQQAHDSPQRRGQDENPDDALLDFRTALANSIDCTGRQFAWPVRLVSGHTVELTEPEEHSLLGARRYFQLDGLADIGNQRIIYDTLSGEEGRVEFTHEFPVTIVTADASLVPTAVAEGKQLSWEIGQYVRAEGTFYRLWSYNSELLNARGSDARQAVPLLVASKLTPSTPVQSIRSSPIGWFGAALFLAVLCIMGLILYLFMQKDVRRRPAKPQAPQA